MSVVYEMKRGLLEINNMNEWKLIEVLLGQAKDEVLQPTGSSYKKLYDLSESPD